MTTTVAYVTYRREPMLQWFLAALKRQAGSGLPKLLIVSPYGVELNGFPGAAWVPPKPTLLQGPHRITKRDYFCGANSRNTALCFAPDGWIVFADDLSVPMPSWWVCVQEAIRANRITAGAYKKVRRLVVENGEAVSWEEYPGGIDSRWNLGRDDGPVPIGGGQLFGCSLAAPVEALLKAGGFDERCDYAGSGSEDYILGMHLEYAGYKLWYDRRMLTLESDERHSWEKPLVRTIEKVDGRLDVSWEMLNRVKSGEWSRATNEHLGPGGIRALRESILHGDQFPVPTGPLINWYSGRATTDY